MQRMYKVSSWPAVALFSGILGFVALLALMAGAAPTGTALAATTVPTSGSMSPINFTAVATSYVPLVQRPSGSLYGYVTEHGSPAPGITVTLEFCKKYSYPPAPPFDLYCSIFDTDRRDTATGADGRYDFVDMPTLVLTDTGTFTYQARQTYQVFWSASQGGNPSRLASWQTQKLDEYTEGERVNIGDFDIGGITLTTPMSGTVVEFPAVFRWTVRANDPQDNYNPCIWGGRIVHPVLPPDRIGCDLPLGPNVDEFTLDQPFDGIDYDSPYYWFVQVTNGQGGSGRSGSNAIQFAQP